MSIMVCAGGASSPVPGGVPPATAAGVSTVPAASAAASTNAADVTVSDGETPPPEDGEKLLSCAAAASAIDGSSEYADGTRGSKGCSSRAGRARVRETSTGGVYVSLGLRNGTVEVMRLSSRREGTDLLDLVVDSGRRSIVGGVVTETGGGVAAATALFNNADSDVGAGIGGGVRVSGGGGGVRYHSSDAACNNDPDSPAEDRLYGETFLATVEDSENVLFNDVESEEVQKKQKQEKGEGENEERKEQEKEEKKLGIEEKPEIKEEKTEEKKEIKEQEEKEKEEIKEKTKIEKEEKKRVVNATTTLRLDVEGSGTEEEGAGEGLLRPGTSIQAGRLGGGVGGEIGRRRGGGRAGGRGHDWRVPVDVYGDIPSSANDWAGTGFVVGLAAEKIISRASTAPSASASVSATPTGTPVAHPISGLGNSASRRGGWGAGSDGVVSGGASGGRPSGRVGRVVDDDVCGDDVQRSFGLCTADGRVCCCRVVSTPEGRPMWRTVWARQTEVRVGEFFNLEPEQEEGRGRRNFVACIEFV